MADEPILSNIFRESRARDQPSDSVDDERLEEALGRAIASARQAWPTVAVPAEIFVRYLARRLPDGAASIEALSAVHVTDLWLACACTHGDPTAVRIFLEKVLAPIFPLPRALKSLSKDVEQIASAKLLVPEGSTLPKIADYSGCGDLESWVSVVALRIALGMTRTGKPEVTVDDRVLSDLPHEDDVEVAHLKQRYRAEFVEAFEHALGKLRPRERNLLRQHLVDGLTMEQIGRIYSVHRITVVRWIERARARLAAETRAQLVTRVGVGELESIMRLIRSQLDLSLRTYFRSGTGA
jgi:RNA polymerase sigma-70 factor (ECF subfamily)